MNNFSAVGQYYLASPEAPYYPSGMEPTLPFIKLYEVAEQLRCSVRTVRSYVSEGKIKAWWRGGERVTTQEAVNEYVRSLRAATEGKE
jgi:excisionase family DNA binding protein